MHSIRSIFIFLSAIFLTVSVLARPLRRIPWYEVINETGVDAGQLNETRDAYLREPTEQHALELAYEKLNDTKHSYQRDCHESRAELYADPETVSCQYLNTGGNYWSCSITQKIRCH
jgi:hypothetical protein